MVQKQQSFFYNHSSKQCSMFNGMQLKHTTPFSTQTWISSFHLSFIPPLVLKGNLLE